MIIFIRISFGQRRGARMMKAPKVKTHSGMGRPMGCFSLGRFPGKRAGQSPILNQENGDG
jgi:hypothetical protein